jgi:uncharacterized membrane protein
MEFHRKETSRKYNKREIPFERIVFFSDAIVAIAITLLALNLKIDIPSTQTLTFKDLLEPWHTYLAFVLSFIFISGFWRMHHYFFLVVSRMDEVLLVLNLAWLFFIIVLPFTTSVWSDHLGDEAAVFFYCLNILCISVLQYIIWLYADNKRDFVNKEQLSEQQHRQVQLRLLLDVVNGLAAVILSFFEPVLAFLILFLKVPFFIIVLLFICENKKNAKHELAGKEKNKMAE